MAKKPLWFIEYRYHKMHDWTEYCRTVVPAMVDHYVHCAKVEFPGSEVRRRIDLNS